MSEEFNDWNIENGVSSVRYRPTDTVLKIHWPPTTPGQEVIISRQCLATFESIKLSTGCNVLF